MELVGGANGNAGRVADAAANAEREVDCEGAEEAAAKENRGADGEEAESG